MSTAGRNRSPSIASESEATAEPVAALHPRVTMLAPVAMMQHNPSRRGSVSAESYQPRLQSTHEKRVVVPKSNEAKLRIAAATGQNLLFRNLETDQRQEVVCVSMDGATMALALCQ